MNIGVLGAGGWGTTLAILLSNNKHTVTLWEYNTDYAETLLTYRENFYFLPKIKISKSIKITSDLLSAVKGKELLLITTPTQYIRNSFSAISDFDFRDKIIVNASKGIENNTLMLVSDIIMDIFRKVKFANIACLSGPSHAEEVSRKIPTAVVCASIRRNISAMVQKIFSNNYFRVYTNTDLKGTELGGALKNVIAIAAGISDGAGFGDNSKAAIMTRGITEIMRIGLKMKARKETFFGLSGIGDLIVTCSSPYSRNRYVGEQIGAGKKLSNILKKMKMVAEGVATARSALKLSQKLNIDAPIVEQVNAVLFGNKSPVSAMKSLMERKLKDEHELK